jgi:HlyD family secretion protein
MAEAKRTNIRLWFWRSLGLIVIVVFFVTQHLLRVQLQVRAERATHQVLTSTVSTNGHVEPASNSVFYSPITTTVKSVNVQPGDRVPAGKVLMVLDDLSARARLATAESGVKAAQAMLEATVHNGTQEQRQASAAEIVRCKLERDQAQHSFDAIVKLSATGAASASEVAAARLRLDSAEAALRAQQESAANRYSPAEVARAQAALADAQAGLAAARQVVAQTVIRSKTAGTVYDIAVHKGDYAEEGKVLLQMGDLTNEQIRAYFDEVDIGRLSSNEKILIKWDAKPGREWHGHILRPPVSVTTYGTRNVGEVLVSIDDADGGLLPSTNVNVTATTSSDPDALSVPRQALHSENGKAFVFKVVNNSLVRTPVTTGIVTLTQAAILNGLQEGDLVATGSINGQPLQEGVPVKVIR